jgi:hypothetical protein
VAAVENQKLFGRPDHHREHRHHGSSAGLSVSDISGGSSSGSSPRPEYRYHTPTESMSSNGSSYASDIRTASSVSTPPLSGSPERVAQKLAAAAAAAAAAADGPPSGLKLDVHAATQQSHAEEGSGLNRADGGYRDRPSISGVERARFADATVLSPQTYVSEASFSRRGGGSSSSSNSNSNGSGQAAKSIARGMSGSTSSDSRRPSEAPDSRRPSTKTSRGPCRGCGEDIVGGKSVSSADGRLTGRYHKQCKEKELCLFLGPRCPAFWRCASVWLTLCVSVRFRLRNVPETLHDVGVLRAQRPAVLRATLPHSQQLAMPGVRSRH